MTWWQVTRACRMFSMKIILYSLFVFKNKKTLFQYMIIHVIKVDYENMLFVEDGHKSRISEYSLVELEKEMRQRRMQLSLI